MATAGYPTDLHDALVTLAGTLTQECGAWLTTVWLYEAETQMLVYAANNLGQPVAERPLVASRPAEGAYYRAIGLREPVVVAGSEARLLAHGLPIDRQALPETLTLVAQPLIYRSRVVGLAVALLAGDGLPTQAQLRRMRLQVNQATATLHQAGLVQAAAAEARQRATLYRAMAATESQAGTMAILHELVNLAQEALRADTASIWTYHAGEDTFEEIAAAGALTHTVDGRPATIPGEGVAGYYRSHPGPHRFRKQPGTSAMALKAGEVLRMPRMPRIRQITTIPLVHDGECLGLLNLAFAGRRGLAVEREPIANLLGERLTNLFVSRGVHKTQTMLDREVDAVTRIAQAVVSGRPNDAILKEVVRATRQALEAVRVALSLRDAERNELRVVVHDGLSVPDLDDQAFAIPLATAVTTSKTLSTGRSLVVDRHGLAAVEPEGLRQRLRVLDAGANLLIPITHESVAVGMLYISFSQPSYASASAVALAERIGKYAAPVVAAAALERQVTDRKLENTALNRMNAAYARSPSSAAVLDRALETANTALGGRCAMIWTFTAVGTPELTAITGDAPADICNELVSAADASPSSRTAVAQQQTLVLDEAQLAETPIGRVFIQRLGAHHLVSVPLLRGDDLLGTLAVCFGPDSTTPDAAAIALTETVARYVSALVAASRARADAEGQLRTQQALQEISEAMVSGLSVEGVLQQIAKASLGALSADRFSVWRYLPQENLFELGPQAGAISETLQVPVRMPAEGSDALTAVLERRVVIYRQAEAVRSASTYKMFGPFGLDTVVLWPVIHDDVPLGVLCGGFREQRQLTEHDVSWGQIIANHAAAALHAAALNERTQQRAQELQALNDIGRMMADGRDAGDSLDDVAAAAVQALAGDALAVWLQVPDRSDLRLDAFAISDRVPPASAESMRSPLFGRGLAAQAVREQRMVQAATLAPSGWPGGRLRPDTGMAQIWAAPISHNGLTLGAVCVGYRVNSKPEQSLDATLQSVANHIAFVLVGTLQQQQMQAREQELAAIQAISAATTLASPGEILSGVCKAARTAVHALRARLWIYDTATDGLYLAGSDPAGPDDDDTPAWKPLPGSPLGEALRAGSLTIVTEQTTNLTSDIQALFRTGVAQAVLLAPIGSTSEPLGVLALAFDHVLSVDQPRVKLAATLAGHSAGAIGRANALEDYRVTEDRLRLVSASSSDVTYSLRISSQGEAELEWVSDGLIDLCGYGAATIGSEGWCVLVHPDDRALYDDRKQRLLAGHADVRDYRIVTRLGQVRTVRDRARPIWSKDDQRFSRVFGAARDVTEEVRTRQTLEALQRVAPATLDALSAHIVILDARGVVLAVNRAWRSFSRSVGPVGLTPPLGLGDNYLAICEDLRGDLVPAASRLGEGIRSVVSGAIEHFSFEYCVPAQDSRWLVATVTLLQSDTRSVVVAHEDITDRKRTEEALLRQAHYDSLTGLPNRTMLFEQLERNLSMAPLSDHKPALLVMDLDRFKEVNDSFGHETGDVLLGLVADRLTNALEEHYLVARLGGDEFAVLVPGDKDSVPAEVVADAVVLALRPAFLVDGLVFDIQASVGVAKYPEHGLDVQTLLRRADVAMYVAKHNGTGTAVYTAEQDRNQPRRLSLLAELRRAIDEDELRVVYHAQVELRTGEVQWVEALVRWLHPTLGPLPPDEFIPIAEQSGLIYQLTRWILRRSLRQVAAWQRQGIPLGVAVNISARDLQLPSFPGFIAASLQRYRVPASRLKLEITESSLIEEPEQATRAIMLLRSRGVRVVLDDFGMGYASLTHLKRLPVDELKIDKSFVSELRVSSLDASIVRLTIELGHQMGASVVAEGVEDAETHRLLTELGCDAAQGFYLAEPAPPERIRAWMLARQSQERPATAV